MTPTELRLLARLFAPPGGVVRRSEFIEAGWQVGAIVSDNTRDQYMRRVRRKLAEICAERTIRTRCGVG